MESPLAIILLFVTMVSGLVAIGNFTIFWKKFWLEKRFDGKSFLYTIGCAVFFISVFFFMQENHELLNIKVSDANAFNWDYRTNTEQILPFFDASYHHCKPLV